MNIQTSYFSFKTFIVLSIHLYSSLQILKIDLYQSWEKFDLQISSVLIDNVISQTFSRQICCIGGLCIKSTLILNLICNQSNLLTQLHWKNSTYCINQILLNILALIHFCDYMIYRISYTFHDFHRIWYETYKVSYAMIE